MLRANSPKLEKTQEMNQSIRKTIEKRHQNLAQERKRIVDLQQLEQESRTNAEKEYNDFAQSK